MSKQNDLLDNAIKMISMYGNRGGRYTPKHGDCCYPLHSQDFIRTGFSQIAYTLSARDYKDPKCVIVEVSNAKSN